MDAVRLGLLLVLLAAAVGAAVIAASMLRRRGEVGARVDAALPHGVLAVDRMEWQVRGCKAIGWVLGGVQSQLVALRAQDARMPRAELLRRVSVVAAATVLPNVDDSVRKSIAESTRAMLEVLWPAELTPRHAAELVVALWGPLCRAIQRRYPTADPEE